ncbi:MAG: HlyC/CorC family transporter [Bacillati bacterium ANGP1]|uniref:HlyC/CorC family transporter n=1 Tax=Candidatus Segetimicrobium genomatis TaxID=2569760 RepID=A0A537K5T6_9BACT|nr:MAG: HlyC/CorC family transporter [Terrabacteria group bacterium ANGP1]
MEDSSIGLRVVLLLVLIVFSAFFSASETALFAANRVVLRQRRAQGDRRAAIANALLSQAGDLLTTLLAGNTLSNVGVSVVATSIAFSLMGRGGEWAAFLATALVLLIIAEIAPKTLAARYADRFVLVVAGPIGTLMRIFTPLIRVLSLVATALIRPFGGHITPRAPLVTEEQLRFLVQLGEEEGVIEQEEREMIHSVFEFGDTVVREVMRPRVDISAVPADATLNRALALMTERGHSRLPVYEGTIDHVLGVVYIRDLIPALRHGRLDQPVSELKRPPFFVPESKKVDELFKEMQQRKVSVAIVLDEYGGTAGLVTVEDLLEEIVGEIQDEYDLEEKPIQLVGDRTAVVNARVHLDEVNELLGVRLPQDEVDTVAGLVYSLFGRVPAPGETFALPGIELRVEKTLGQRITRVRITRTTPAPQEEAAPL